METKSKNKKRVAVVLAVLVVVLVAGYYMWQSGILKLPMAAAGSDYQAIFLTNGQVYFGKAANLNGNYINLSDVYYLQVSQTLQPAGKNTTPQQSVSLAKLGVAELHKPKDSMMINRDQVLFIESMQSDSQVVQAIASYKATLKK